jgi:hypothetical protein
MFSATDVANFLSCHHLLTLDRAETAGDIRRPFFNDPGINLLRELGIRHENAYLSGAGSCGSTRLGGILAFSSLSRVASFYNVT